MAYLKPQTPIQLQDNYIYPLTTADQVIVDNGNRLNSLFKKTIQENVTLLASGWSKSAPYTQTIILTESTDDYKVDANVIYGGDELDIALNKAAGYITYIKKNHKKITFYCLKNKPEIDIPVEIVGTCRNTITTVIDGVKLNFDVVAYSSEAEMLANMPLENTIGVITDTPITGYQFNNIEPEDMSDGELWISTGMGVGSNITLNVVDCVQIYPIFAKQYIDGVFVNVIAKSYQNGEWVEWITYLYKNGNEFTNLTGDFSITYSNNKGTGTLTKNTDNLYLYSKGSTGSGANFFVYTGNKIDLTNFSTLYAKIDYTAIKSTRFYLCLSTNNTASTPNAMNSIRETTNGVVSLDVSTMEGEYYVGIGLTGSAVANEGKCYVYEMYLK